MNIEKRVQWVYDSTYEQDMFQGFDYQSPRLLAEAFKKFVTTDAKILDVGSGTGLMGQTLSSLGYHNLVALDMSEEMLDIACEKGVYESGLILFTLYSDLYDIGEFPEKFAALEASGAWSLQEVSDELQPLPVGEPEATVRVIVYEVN